MDTMYVGTGSADTRTVPSAPPQPLLPNIMERLHNARATLTDAGAELAAVRTRLFGAYPTNGQTAAKADQASAEAEVMALIEHVMELALDIRQSASTLNSRL